MKRQPTHRSSVPCLHSGVEDESIAPNATAAKVGITMNESDTAIAGPCTPPDRLIPGTGGRYEDWPYHPSRLQDAGESGDKPSSAQERATVADASTQNDDLSGDDRANPQGSAASMDSDQSIQSASTASVALHDTRYIAGFSDWNVTPLDCYRQQHNASSSRNHQRIKNAK